ncbi:MAG: helix-turn-helix transcriptional regulator [Clostridia bacterium]|nr:helix-turn-helix transcriptional regulator [Clostridia bacterium]
MNTEFNKIVYDSSFGYIITHTEGMSAENSTLDYPHSTANFIIYYFIHGTGNIKIEGRHYDINEGDIVILDPSEVFHCTVDSNKLHERIVLHLNETLLKNFPCDCTSLFMPFYKKEKGINNHLSAATVKKYGLDKALENMLYLVKSEDSISSVLVICKIIEFLAQLNKIFSTAQSKDSEHTKVNPLINMVLDYLNKNFTKDFNITDIALKFNIDKSYLSHLFKEQVGISVWSYVIFRRIYLFNNLIKQGKSIEETSRQVGFKNYSNFFRLYKKHMQMTPMQFKKKTSIL